MSGADLIRDLRIATSGARRAIAIAERAINSLEERVEALAASAWQNDEARAAAFAATGEVLLTVDDVAGILHVSKPTLARWRTLGTGPAYVKKQGRILYRAETIENFVTSNERIRTRDDDPGRR